MRKRLLVLILLVGLLLPALPVVLSPTPVDAASYYTFHNIEPAAEVTISHNDTWETINATTYGVPLGATGIIYTANNWEGSGGDDEPFGIRKHGSTDNRIDPLWEHTPTWGLMGVDENCLFDLYSGSDTTSFGVWIIGYTTVGVTFFTNAYDKTPAGMGTFDIDCSAEAPSATGLIFEVVGPSRGETMTHFGMWKKGSTTGWIYNAADHLAPGVMIGCDANQVVEAYTGGLYKFYLIGYVYDGAYFYTNSVYQGPTTANAWVDLTALPAGATMGFYDYHGSGSAYRNGIRANGSGWLLSSLDARHCWAYAGCDGAGLVEGYVGDTSVGYWLVGYAIPGTYNILTQAATDVTSVSATLHGTVTDDNGEQVGLLGFQWGLTQTPTWQWYQTGSAEFWINPSSTNYMYAPNPGYQRLGQRITLAHNITSLSFYLKKTGAPTGDISYRIDTAAGTNVWNSVLFDASNLTGVVTDYKITFNTTLSVAGDHRMYTYYPAGGDVANYVEHGYRAANVGEGVYTRMISGGDTWSDSDTQEAGIKFDYEFPADYGEISFNYTVTGLNDNTQYYYRAYMTTSGSTYYGQWMPFGTANQPLVTTLPASSVAMTTARLNSLIDADGDQPVTIRFGWGNTTETAIVDYQFFADLPGTYSEGEHPYLNVDGLDPSTTYYFRVEGENVNGANTGDELSFTTVDLTAAVSNFRGTPYPTYIDLSWDTLVGASNYLIRYAYGGFTNSTTGGFQAYFGSTASARHSDLEPGRSIWYTIWGESGGYYAAPAYLMMTTTAGGGGAPTDVDYDAPTMIARWLTGTDYTNMANLGFIYTIVNNTAASLSIPYNTMWFLIALGLSVVVGVIVYVKSRGKLLIAAIALTVALVLGWMMKLVPFWIPLASGILIIASVVGHKEVARG